MNITVKPYVIPAGDAELAAALGLVTSEEAAQEELRQSWEAEASVEREMPGDDEIDRIFGEAGAEPDCLLTMSHGDGVLTIRMVFPRLEGEGEPAAMARAAALAMAFLARS